MMLLPEGGRVMADKYSPLAIANAFLEIAKRHGNGISPMKLQKLVYFAHAWNLAYFNEGLINEPIYAWRFGPVIESIYGQFKHYGWQDIEYPGMINNPAWNPFFDQGIPQYLVPRLDAREPDQAEKLSMLNSMWDLYGHMSAEELSDLTHKDHTPWGKTADKHLNGKIKNFELKDDLIRNCLLAEIYGTQPSGVTTENQTEVDLNEKAFVQ